MSPFNMSLRDFILRLQDARNGRIVKPGRQAILTHQPLRNLDTFLHSASATLDSFSEFGSRSDRGMQSYLMSVSALAALRMPFRLDR